MQAGDAHPSVPKSGMAILPRKMQPASLTRAEGKGGVCSLENTDLGPDAKGTHDGVCIGPDS